MKTKDRVEVAKKLLVIARKLASHTDLPKSVDELPKDIQGMLMKIKKLYFKERILSTRGVTPQQMYDVAVYNSGSESLEALRDNLEKDLKVVK